TALRIVEVAARLGRSGLEPELGNRLGERAEAAAAAYLGRERIPALAADRAQLAHRRAQRGEPRRTGDLALLRIAARRRPDAAALDQRAAQLGVRLAGQEVWTAH